MEKPKTDYSKRMRPASSKQKKFVLGIAKGLSVPDAVQQAYNVKTRHAASVIGSENMRKPTIRRLLAEQGLKEESILKTLNETMEATRPVVVKNELQDYPDYHVRLRTAELCLKLLGHLDSPEKAAQLPPSIKIQFVKISSNGEKRILKTI